jgi:hypothetical protein
MKCIHSIKFLVHSVSRKESIHTVKSPVFSDLKIVKLMEKVLYIFCSDKHLAMCDNSDACRSVHETLCKVSDISVHFSSKLDA